MYKLDLKISSEEKLDIFSNLPDGWNYGEGCAPPVSRIQEAKNFLKFLNGFWFSETDVFPGTDGEIVIRAYNNDNMLEFLFEIDNTINCLLEQNGKETEYEEGVSLNQAQIFVVRCRDIIFDTQCYVREDFSDSLTQYITTKTVVDFQVWHLKNLPQTRQPHSSAWVASFPRELASVFTQQNTTLVMSQESPRLLRCSIH